MSAPKKILVASLCLFGVIGSIAAIKKVVSIQQPKQVPLEEEKAVSSVDKEELLMEEKKHDERIQELFNPVQDRLSKEQVDNVWRLFTTGPQKLPIVETIRYKRRVPWLKGASAWIANYASHYRTSRHFIARSLNQKADYHTQKISEGDQFNVLRLDRKIEFYLVVDLSRCKMWFYSYDRDENERFLLKIYSVGLGRFNKNVISSGILTPKGSFLIGEKVASYKPKMRGYFQGEDIEMVQVFGTRWIPFGEKINEKGEDPRGYGFHGAPWVYDQETKDYKEDQAAIGNYSSDGCIRLSQKDIEELYAIIISRKTIVEIVSDYKEAHLPGIEAKK